MNTQTQLTCQQQMTYCAQSPCGRVPPALRQCDPSDQASLLAAHLAGAARLEGAAVLAFEVLEREMLAHRAPGALVARVRSAQSDEERHRRSMSALAARLGARVLPVEIEPIDVRTLLEIAVENAAEGCVRETYGAAVAVFQAARASVPAIRAAMHSIAPDEAEHASLGWAIDAWARARLSRSERALLDDARHAAAQALIAQAREEGPPAVTGILGVPDADASARLIGALAPLWS